MDAERADQLQNARVGQLLLEGEKAFNEGDLHTAHEVWREAATLDPYNESVWMTLLKVLDSEDDRIVCLENIIAINPLNVEARRLLRREMGQPELPQVKPSAPTRKASTVMPIPYRREHPLRILSRGLMIGVGLGVLGIVVAVIITVLWNIQYPF